MCWTSLILLVGSIPNRGVFPFSRDNSIGSLYPADDGQARRSANGYFKAAKTGIRKKIPTIATPDSEVVLLTNKFVAPLTSVIITQNTFRINYGRKHNKVNGFFEDQYLQPGYFIPDKKALIGHGINPHEKYAVIRFVGWTANHDLFKKGITMKQKEEFVNALNKHCKVYVSSEKALSPRLSKFLLPTPPNLVHQVLHFASLYVGDSQTMATEAALLGTPSVRVNSFVGQNDMSNFMELENNYKMLYNFPDISAATNKAIELIESSAVKDEWLQKRAAYYCNRGDINDEILEIILDTVKQKINRVSVDGK